MRTPLTTAPQLVEGYALFLAAMQLTARPGTCEPWAVSPFPALDCRKSLDDLDEETDDVDDEDEDLDEDFEEDEDEDEDDDLEDDYDDEDDEEDEDEDDEEEDEDDEDEVKPLEM